MSAREDKSGLKLRLYTASTLTKDAAPNYVRKLISQLPGMIGVAPSRVNASFVPAGASQQRPDAHVVLNIKGYDDMARVEQVLQRGFGVSYSEGQHTF